MKRTMNYHALRRAIDARDPGLPPAPLSADFVAELDALQAALEAGPGIHHPLDLFIVIELFDRLYHAGEHGAPQLVAGHLMERHGWPRADAEKVAYTWEVVAGLRNKDRLRADAASARPLRRGRNR